MFPIYYCLFTMMQLFLFLEMVVFFLGFIEEQLVYVEQKLKRSNGTFVSRHNQYRKAHSELGMHKKKNFKKKT